MFALAYKYIISPLPKRAIYSYILKHQCLNLSLTTTRLLSLIHSSRSVQFAVHQDYGVTQWIISPIARALLRFFFFFFPVLDCVWRVFLRLSLKLEQRASPLGRQTCRAGRVDSTESERPISLIWSPHRLFNGTIRDLETQPILFPPHPLPPSNYATCCWIFFCFKFLRLLSFKKKKKEKH